jgi:hypothetical protein
VLRRVMTGREGDGACFRHFLGCRIVRHATQ